MATIHYLGDYALAVQLLEPVHAADKNNISTAEMLYFAYFCQVFQICGLIQCVSHEIARL